MLSTLVGEIYRGRIYRGSWTTHLRHHDTLLALCTDHTKRDALGEAHRAAVDAALVVLEKTLRLRLVGIRVLYYREVERGEYWYGIYMRTSKTPVFGTEFLFSSRGLQRANGRSGWRAIGSVKDARRTVLPASHAAFAAYHLSLGQEVPITLGVDVSFDTSPENNSLPVAVFK